MGYVGTLGDKVSAYAEVSTVTTPLTVVRHFLSHLKHGLVEDGLRQRHTATTTSTSLGAGLDFTHGLASSVLDRFDHITLGHIVTRADLNAVITVGKILATSKTTKSRNMLTGHQHSPHHRPAPRE